MLLDLPAELLLEILKSAPCLWSVIALRLSCRMLDTIYRDNEKTILVAQQDRITQPMIRYYRLLSKLHIWPEHLKLPPHAINHVTNKTPFALDVLRNMPYFIREEPGFNAIADCDQNLDWTLVPSGRAHYHADDCHGQFYAGREPKHCICLTEHLVNLDTIQGEIDGTPVAFYWQRLTDRIMSGELVFVPGESWAIVSGKLVPELFRGPDGKVEALLEILRKHGWPENFQQKPGITEIDAFVQSFWMPWP